MQPLLARPGTRQIAFTSALFAVLMGGLTVGLWFLAATVLSRALTQLPVQGSLLLGLSLSWIGRGTLQALRDHLVFVQAQHIKTTWRQELLQNQLNQNANLQEQQVLGKTLSVLDDGLEQVSKFHGRFLPVVASSPVMSGLVLMVLFTQDWVSGLLLMVTGPVLIVFMVLIGYATQVVQEKQFQSLTLLSSAFVRTLRTAPILRAFERQQKTLTALQETNRILSVRTLQVLKVAFLSGFVLELGATLGTAMVAVAVGIRLSENSMDYFTALFVLLLTPEYFLGLRQLGTEHHAFMEAKAVLPEVLALTPEPTKKPTHTATLHTPPEIRLEGVSLQRGNQQILKGLTLVVPAGGLLNICGPSGSGKSTVLSALLGLREVQDGQVLLSGHAAQHISEAEMKTKVAYVSQHPVFLAATVRDNLLAANPQASETQLRQSLQKTLLWEALQTRGGLDLQLSEGALNLSAGERARFALSRAFLKEATLLVLDEPTAHLDHATEQALLPVLHHLRAGKTTVLVTHRRTLHFPGAQVLSLGTKEAEHA
ncbi:thiol reductant ABC exporter subunit CydD [Deinococcus roseus]|uniref:Thiol reductant ABC exporter subunit CydD n=1 Tax=Deinococcus roseus TaxID=392414 RepID=A0ABQ2CZC6_9DEIO|nr:thiol reductant ABC exporter subunit CydD [Deinococcus roseus]GGJ28788.1 hypothetical protein GCM10008938_13600 [Deinococcus roseus]